MKLTVSNLHKRTHKALVITGNKSKVEKAVELINEQRLDYKMDYSDSEDLENGQYMAEFVTHRSHHKVAAKFINSVINSI